jgi:heat shock protein 5
MKNSVEDKEKLADKLSDEDKSTVKDALTDAQDWLNANADAEKDDFEDKLKELQTVCDPIVSKVYQAAQKVDKSTRKNSRGKSGRYTIL